MFRAFRPQLPKGLKEARQLVRLIHRSPHEVWIDEAGIDPGEGFPEKIVHSIDQSDYFMLLWSKNSKESRWVEREWNYAYKESKRILPVLLDKTPLPMALENINAFTSLDDQRLYRFLNVSKLSDQVNNLEKIVSVIKKRFKGIN